MCAVRKHATLSGAETPAVATAVGAAFADDHVALTGVPPDEKAPSVTEASTTISTKAVTRSSHHPRLASDGLRCR